MADPGESLSQDYFNRLYRENEDPWRYESSEYESKKYDHTLRSLPRDRYQNALEIGCSIGVFTSKLAPKCARLSSIDIAPAAIEKAREHCREFQHVRFEVMNVAEDYPAGEFDLIVLSETGYYLSRQKLANLADQITKQSVPCAHLLLVHWLPQIPGAPLRGDEVHDHFVKLPTWRAARGYRNERYRLDVLERQPCSQDPI